MSEKAPYTRDTPDPPQLEIGERVEAQIRNILKVDSQWGKQYQVELELENGYKFKDWIQYYDQPTNQSRLGQLGNTIYSKLGKHQTIEEGISILKDYGMVFVECTKYRQHEGKSYPKLKVITTYLPAHQEIL